MADTLDSILYGSAAETTAPTGPVENRLVNVDPAQDSLDAILYDSAPTVDMRPPADGIPEPVPGWSQSMKSVTDRLQLGVGSLTKGAAGLRLIAPGSDFSLDAAREQFETQELIRAQQDTDAYIKTNGYLGLASNIPGWALEQLPVSALGLAGTVGGVGVGMMLGAPLVGSALVGGGLVVGAITAGNVGYELMSRGVSRDTARWGGFFSGLAGGALEMLGFKGLAKGGEVALKAAAKTKIFREKMIKLAEGLALSTGAEVSTEAAQSLADSFIKYMATQVVEKVDQPFTLEEAQQDLVDSMIRAAVVAPQFGGASVVLGNLLGERARIAEEDIAAAQKDKAKPGTPPYKPAEATAMQVKRAQVKAKRTLTGMVEVTDTPDLATARDNVKQAKIALDDARSEGRDTTFRQLELDLAKAELKAAEIDNALFQIEDLITDPKADENLRTSLEDRKVKLEKQLDDVSRGIALNKLKRKMAQRERSIDKLRGQIREMKQEARDSGAEEGAQTAELRASLEQLREQQSIDQMALDLFNEDLMRPGDVALLKPEVPVRRLQGFVKAARKQIDGAAKDGGKAQAQRTKDIRKLLVKIIENSRLPEKDRLALMRRIEAVDSFAKLQKIAPNLIDDIDTLLVERQRQTVEALADKIIGGIEFRKSAPSRFPSTEEKLLALKQFYEAPESVLDFEAAIEKKGLEGEALTALDEVKLDLAALFPRESVELANKIKAEENLQRSIKEMLKDSSLDESKLRELDNELGWSRRRARALKAEAKMPTETLERMIDLAVELKANGRAEALRRSAEIEARQSKNLSSFWRAATVRPDGTVTSKEERGTKLDRFVNDTATPFATWRLLQGIITQKGTVSDLANVFDPKRANSKALGQYQDWSNNYEAAMQSRGIDRALFAKINQDLEKDADILEFSRKEGDMLVSTKLRTPDTAEPFTIGQLVDLRNMLLDRDPDAVSRFKFGNKFTYPGDVPKNLSTLEVVEDYLKREYPDAIKLSDAQRQIYREFHAVVDDAAYARTGRRIELNPTYGGSLLTDSTQTGVSEMFRRITLKPKSLNERQGSDKRVELRNAHDKLLEHLWQYSRESAWRDYEKDMPALYGDQEVADFIRGNYGKHTYKVLMNTVNDMLRGGYSVYSEMAKQWGWLRKRAFTFFLGGKPEQYWKQLTSVFYGLQHSTMQEMVDGHADFLADPKRAVERMNQSPLLRARGWLINPNDLDASMRFRKSKLDVVAESTMKAVERGDIHGVYLSSYPALVAELRKSGNMEKAIARFEDVFESINSSGNLEELPAIFRGNIFERMLTLFAQQPTAQASLISLEFMKAKNGQKGALQSFWKTLGVSYFGAMAYNLVGWALQRPFLSDDDANDRLKTILALAPLGPYAQLPIYGQALTVLYLQGMNVVWDAKLKVFVPELLLLDTLKSGFTAVTNVLKAAKDGDDPKTVQRAIWSALDLSGRLSGLPTTNILRPARGLTQ